MKILVGDRQSGKSWAAAQWWLEDTTNRGIICAREQGAELLRVRIRTEIVTTLVANSPDFLRDLTHNIVSAGVGNRAIGRPHGFTWVVDEYEDVFYNLLGLVPEFVTGPMPEIAELPTVEQRREQINEEIRGHYDEIRRLGKQRFDLIWGKAR